MVLNLLNYKIYYSVDGTTYTEYTEAIANIEKDATVYVKLGLSVTYKEVATIYYSTPVEVTVVEPVFGDLNGDRVVDAADQALVRRAVLGDTTIIGADLNADSVVDICDLVYISLLMNV